MRKRYDAIFETIINCMVATIIAGLIAYAMMHDSLK